MSGKAQVMEPGGAGLAGWLARDRARTCAVILLLGLALFLPGFFSLPPLDRDEGRFAQASKQMVETGNYIDIRYQETPRYLKPIGIYWLQSAAAWASGQGADAPIWVFRLPSLLGAIAALMLCYWACLALGPPRAALLATMLLAGSLVLGVEARLAKTDAVLLACALLAQGALARLFLRPDDPAQGRWRAIFWMALGAGFLVKGPVVPMVAGLCCAFICLVHRSGALWRALRPMSGIGLMLAIVLPWFIAITVVSGGEFYEAALGKDMLGKLYESQENHGAPPGTHLLASLLSYWPMTPFAFLAAPFVWRNRRSAPVLFALAWLLPGWLVFELAATKLPHYTLPLAPAAAMLIALAAERGEARLRAWWQHAGLAAGPLVASLIAGAAFAVPYYLEGRIFWPGAMVMLGMAGCMFLAWRLAWRGDAIGSITLACLGAVVYAWAGYGLIAPSLNTLWVSPRLVQAARAAQPSCAKVQIATTGYREPSLVFLAGTDTLLTSGAGAADFLAGGACRAALVEGRQEREFLEAAARLNLEPGARGRVAGIALNGLKPVDIGVYAGARGGQ